MKNPDILLALEPVVKSFEKIGIDYYVGGSVASSVYGIPRATLDVDLVANIAPNQVPELFQTLKSTFYIDDNMILDAIRRKSSFNVIHLETMLKIDIFILKNTSYDRTAFQRRQKDTLDEENETLFYLASAEDIILNKLMWYRMGGKVSDRQWSDILGVFKVQHNLLDMEYLQYWAEELHLTDLLNEAFQDSQ
jgi:hypothetical protein